MTVPIPDPPTLEFHATARCPIPEGTPPIQDDSAKQRWFSPTEATINYEQEKTDPGGVEEKVTDWDVTVVVSGPLLTSGSTGRRPTRVTYRRDSEQDTIPSWLNEHVERYHPSKHL